MAVEKKTKKVIVKTVNRTGKSLVKKALVVKAKKQSNITAENIKRLNEKILSKKINDKRATSNDQGETSNDKRATINEQREKVKEDKKYELTIGLKDLLQAGCHLGHKVSKTHPKARENIYMVKDGISIFDLTVTLKNLETACNFVYNARRNGKQIVLVGTKRQAREVIARVANDAGVAYVTDRWLGGTISNWEQIKKNIKKLNDIKDGLERGSFTDKTKKELGDMAKEQKRLERMIGGLSHLEKMFDLIFVVDAGFEKTAIKEAKMRNVKTVAITDTDTNPQKVDFAITANDDSVKSINILVEEIGRAIKAAGVK